MGEKNAGGKRAYLRDFEDAGVPHSPRRVLEEGLEDGPDLLDEDLGIVDLEEDRVDSVHSDSVNRVLRKSFEVAEHVVEEFGDRSQQVLQVLSQGGTHLGDFGPGADLDVLQNVLESGVADVCC